MITEQDLGKWVEVDSQAKKYDYGVLISMDTVYFPFADHEIKDINEVKIVRVLEHIRNGFRMDEFHK